MWVKLAPYIAVAITFIGSIFLTRYLTQKEQQAIDQTNYTLALANAKDSISVEYHQRTIQAVSDTLKHFKAATRPAIGSPPVVSVRGGAESQPGQCPADSLQAVIDSSNVERHTEFTADDGALVAIDYRGSIDGLIYTAPNRTVDSVIVHDFKKIPVETVNADLTGGHIAVVAVVTLGVIEGLRYLFTKKL